MKKTETVEYTTCTRNVVRSFFFFVFLRQRLRILYKIDDRKTYIYIYIHIHACVYLENGRCLVYNNNTNNNFYYYRRYSMALKTRKCLGFAVLRPVQLKLDGVAET